MAWFFLTILSALFGAGSKVLQRFLLKDDDRDPAAFSVVFQSLVALLFLIYTVATGTFELPNLLPMWPNVLFMTIIYAVANLLTFKAFQKAEASEIVVLFASSTIWSVIAAMVVLGESISARQLLGIGIVIGGVCLINIKGWRWHFNQGHWYALLAAACFGVAFINDVAILKAYHHVSAFMVLAFSLPVVAVLAVKSRALRDVPSFFTRQALPKLILCCLFYALSALTIYTATKIGGPASLISPISQTIIIFTVILGYFFLHEKDRLWQKSLGTLLTFGGIWLLF